MKKQSIPDFVTARSQKVALGCPDYLTEQLSILVNDPFVVTSANVSGDEVILDPDKSIAQFGDQVEAIMEGPILPGIVNTILDLTKDPPIVLREGGISKMVLKKSIPGGEFA